MANETAENKRLIMSGRALLEKLDAGDKMVLPVNGFYRRHVEGKTKVGNRSFEGYQYTFIPRKETDPVITITENSAGGKMIARQMEAFKEQHPTSGELGHYESVVTFEHVTSIIDRNTGKSKDVDFLSVNIDPHSLGKRTFTPSGVRYELPEENTEYQLSSKN